VPAASIPDHDLIRLIGSGGYGEVWLAKTAVGTFRAVKIVFEKTFTDIRPFEREFNGVLKFEPLSRSHDGLVDVLQVGRNDAAGYFYYVMEVADDVRSGQEIEPDNYLPRTLAQDMAQHKRLPPEECLRIGVTIASALVFLHHHDLIHRDVKPSNIIFVKGIPKLADIGLVVETAAAKSYVGTEGFIPPEGPGTPQADVYSLGKVLYEISTGRDRHEFPELPTLLGDLNRASVELNKVILKACRRDPRQRYQTAKTIADDLLRLQRGEHLSFWNTARRLLRRPATIGTILLCLGAFAWGISLFHQSNPEAVPAPPGLVGWWRGEGNALDQLGRNDGTLEGGVRCVPGKVGMAFDFDREWKRVFIPDGPDFKLTNSLSIEGWIYPRKPEKTLGIRCMVFIRGDNRPGLDPYQISLVPPGQIIFQVMTPLNEFANLLAPVQFNKWQHVAGTLDGASGDMKLYVDGILSAHTNTTLRPLCDLDPTQEPAIGIGNMGGSSGEFPFNGLVDEISLYNRALRESEVKAIYKAGSAGKTPSPPLAGLVNWWRAEGDTRNAVNGKLAMLKGGASFGPGKIGRAFDFNRTSARIEVPRNDVWDFGTNNFTVALWANFRSVESSTIDHPWGGVFIGCDEGPFQVNKWWFAYGGGRLSFHINSPAMEPAWLAQAPFTPASNQWYHLAVVRSGSLYTSYCDGIAIGSDTNSTPIPAPNAPLTIGMAEGYYFNGLLDEILIYNRDLSAAEIQAMYRAGNAWQKTGALTNTPPPSPASR
jgi:hypothetical protein